MPVWSVECDDAGIVGSAAARWLAGQPREMSVVPAQALPVPKDSPADEGDPVNGTREPRERTPGAGADRAFVIVAGLQWADKIELGSPSPCGNIGRSDCRCLEPLVNPGHKQRIAKARMDCGRSRKQRF